MSRILSALASDKPFVAAFGAFVAAVLASLGLADLSSSAVTVVDAVAGLVVTIYVGGTAHVAAQTAKAAAPPSSATVTTTPAVPPAVQADVARAADMLKAAADVLTSAGG